MRYLLLLLLTFVSIISHAQFHFGLYGGITNYYGDLNDRAFNRPQAAAGVTLGYEISDRLMLRAGYTLAKVEGADRYSGSEQRVLDRNLSFQSRISEFSLVAELTAFNLYKIRWSPYAFGGLAVFHFDPYAFDQAGNKVYLRPLSTEGQGLPEYAQKLPYSLTDLAIPYGIGVKYVISDRFRVAAELGIRKTFTDYLDDVSGKYMDPTILEQHRGPLAVAMSYRGGEAGGAATYPEKGFERGNDTRNDGYYFTGVHFTYAFDPINSNRRKYKEMNCPKVPKN